MELMRVSVMLITLLRYTYVCIIQLFINVCKGHEYSGSIVASISHEHPLSQKLHRVQKCIHTCTVYWCSIIAQFISVCVYISN